MVSEDEEEGTAEEPLFLFPNTCQDAPSSGTSQGTSDTSFLRVITQAPPRHSDDPLASATQSSLSSKRKDKHSATKPKTGFAGKRGGHGKKRGW
jgi:hypothetical protein